MYPRRGSELQADQISLAMRHDAPAPLHSAGTRRTSPDGRFRADASAAGGAGAKPPIFKHRTRGSFVTVGRQLSPFDQPERPFGDPLATNHLTGASSTRAPKAFADPDGRFLTSSMAASQAPLRPELAEYRPIAGMATKGTALGRARGEMMPRPTTADAR